MNEPNNRQPVYAKHSRDRRVVSVANGLWQAQKRTTEHGTDKHDNWQTISKPTNWENAQQQARLEAKD